MNSIDGKPPLPPQLKHQSKQEMAQKIMDRHDKRVEELDAKFHKNVIQLIDDFLEAPENQNGLTEQDKKYMDEVKAIRAMHLKKLV